MSNLFEIIQRKPMVWVVVIVAFFVAAAAVSAVLPTISLNSATAFPVDI